MHIVIDIFISYTHTNLTNLDTTCSFMSVINYSVSASIYPSMQRVPEAVLSWETATEDYYIPIIP